MEEILHGRKIMAAPWGAAIMGCWLLFLAFDSEFVDLDV